MQSNTTNSNTTNTHVNSFIYFKLNLKAQSDNVIYGFYTSNLKLFIYKYIFWNNDDYNIYIYTNLFPHVILYSYFKSDFESINFYKIAT
jgi:hypothetical protein